MKITIFEGIKGSGMTLAAVYLAFEESRRTGKPILCGIGLGPYEYVDEEYFRKELGNE